MTKEEILELVSEGDLALCPLDGRYEEIRDAIAPYCSNFALARERVRMMVEWWSWMMRHIDKLPPEVKRPTEEQLKQAHTIISDFAANDMALLKDIESRTKHDVKAVEMFVSSRLRQMDIPATSYVHFGCTSEDVTNIAYASMISMTMKQVMIPAMRELIESLKGMVKKYAAVPMLAHTHGQPATPTTVGKELGIYVWRLSNSLSAIEAIEPEAKLNGATGNYAAAAFALPDDDWEDMSSTFIQSCYDFVYNPLTPQIETHDWICRLLNEITLFANILHNFDVDVWTYISMEYFCQIPVATEVGSSTMPAKINPIKFENSEANAELCVGLARTLSDTLSQTRMQRDLTDSTTLRNLAMVFGYLLQSVRQCNSGLKRIDVNAKRLKRDLDAHPEVLAEAIQTVLRKYGDTDAYNKLKDLTRGKKITLKSLRNYISGLTLEAVDKRRLLDLLPEDYIGYAVALAEMASTL